MPAQAHPPPAQLPANPRQPHRPNVHLPAAPAAQASAEIERLKHARPSTRTEVRIERKQIADQIATGPDDAARVRDDEISGHGI